MSRSNATEIIALLWLIAATQLDGWLGVACAVMFVENTLESIIFAFKDRKPTNKQIVGE